MEKKYKVGDKVKIVKDFGYFDPEFMTLNSDKTLEIVRVNGVFAEYEIKDSRGDTQFADDVHLELAQETKTPTSLDDALGMVKETPTKKRLMTLPTDSARRKEFPVLSGFIKYFPAAIAGVANTSKLGNDKHNPGQELHHDRSKSMDHGDCIVRHLMDVEDLIAAAKKHPNKSAYEQEILLEASSLVWRALAYSQELHEKYGAPLAPSAKKEEGK